MSRPKCVIVECVAKGYINRGEFVTINDENGTKVACKVMYETPAKPKMSISYISTIMANITNKIKRFLMNSDNKVEGDKKEEH